MAEGGPPVLGEVRLDGEIPLWSVPGWRESHGVVAGITGRGPVAGQDFDLGLAGSGPVGEVLERWRGLLRAIPGFHTAVLGRQVHGCVVRVQVGAEGGWIQVGGVDGHLSTTPGVLLLVTVADCVPVYLIDPTRPAVALLHAGWRGVAGGILEAGVAALEAHGSVVENLAMHCGVAISGPCYEVGGEVFGALGLPRPEGGRARLDLREQLVERGRALGVRAVTVSPHCTATDEADFFSHRRSGGRDGRQVAYLGIPSGRAVPPPL